MGIEDDAFCDGGKRKRDLSVSAEDSGVGGDGEGGELAFGGDDLDGVAEEGAGEVTSEEDVVDEEAREDAVVESMSGTKEEGSNARKAATLKGGGNGVDLGERGPIVPVDIERVFVSEDAEFGVRESGGEGEGKEAFGFGEGKELRGW